MCRTISIFGVTGSIGQNTLNVLRSFDYRSNFEILVFSANENVELLAKNALEFNAKYAVVTNEKKYQQLKNLLSGSLVSALAGNEALEDLTQLNADWTMNAIIGSAGLKTSIFCAKFGKVLALANKESLVCAGDLLMGTIKKSGGSLIPVDSEHSAIFQCLQGEEMASVEKITLTASGGPFRDWNKKMMANVTLKQALAHPNWKMGKRITIDSATMFNKALELIEAKHLFDVLPKNLDVIVHPESIIHSMVSFIDGSVLAQLSVPDMQGAIGYALNFPKRLFLPIERLNLIELANLNFEKPDDEKFPALSLAFSVMEKGGLYGATFNAAKEVALDKFINKEIRFLQMVELVKFVLNSPKLDILDNMDDYSLDDVLNADAISREIALSYRAKS